MKHFKPLTLTLLCSLTAAASPAMASTALTVFTKSTPLESVSGQILKEQIQNSLHYRSAKRCDAIQTLKRSNQMGDRLIISYVAKTKCNDDNSKSFSIEVRAEKFADLPSNPNEKPKFYITDAKLTVERKLLPQVRAALWADMDGDGQLDLATITDSNVKEKYGVSFSLSKNKTSPSYKNLLLPGSYGDAGNSRDLTKTLGLSLAENGNGVIIERSSENDVLHSWVYSILVNVAGEIPTVAKLDYMDEIYNRGHGELNEENGFVYDFTEHKGTIYSGLEENSSYNFSGDCNLSLEQLDKHGIPTCAQAK